MIIFHHVHCQAEPHGLHAQIRLYEQPAQDLALGAGSVGSQGDEAGAIYAARPLTAARIARP